MEKRKTVIMEKALFTTGLLGLLASLMVGMGEYMIHFNPEGLELDQAYGYFLGIEPARLRQGHYIMVPFIPLYIFGYWHLYLALKPGSKRLATSVLVLGVFAFVIGGIWVGSRAYFGHVVQALQDAQYKEVRTDLILSYEALIESLVQILRILIFLISILFVWAILKGGTLYPKWVAIFNPITLLIIVFALFFFVRPVGQYLAPTAMNVAHLLLFSASLFALSGKSSSHVNE